MRYKNTKTGAIVDSPCVIKGGDWILDSKEVVEELDKEEAKAEQIEEVIYEEINQNDLDDLNGITVKEIKQELDAMGIKYDPKARKQDLYNLMFKGR